MNIYMVERTDGRVGYDEYDAFIVAAEDEADAVKFHPNGDEQVEPDPPYGSWPADRVTFSVKLIGEAAPGIERGVVLASFNAG